MGFEQPVVSGAVRTSGFFVSPIGRVNLFITLFFFFVLCFVGVSESFDQGSAYPFFYRVVLPFVGADAVIGMEVDAVESFPRPVFDSVFSKSFPVWLWFWLKFWFIVISHLWFLYFLCWLIYGFWYSLNTSMIFQNVLLTIVTFLLLSLFVGMALYNVRLSGLCLPDDPAKNFSLQLRNSYPLHGTVKLVSHFFSRDLFYRVADWGSSDFGRLVSNLPDDVDLLNVSVNVSDVS